MTTRKTTPGILHHSMTTNLGPSEQAITITALQNVKNPISNSTSHSISNHKFAHLNTEKLQDFVELAKADLLRQKTQPIYTEPQQIYRNSEIFNGQLANNQEIHLTEEFLDANVNNNNNQFSARNHQVHQNQDHNLPNVQAVNSKIETHVMKPSDEQVLLMDINNLISEFKKVAVKTKTQTQDLIETEAGLAERKRTLVRLNEKKRQLNRQFYTFKTENYNFRSDKLLKNTVKIVELFLKQLADLVSLKNVQRFDNLCWPELKKMLLPVLPTIEVRKKLADRYFHSGNNNNSVQQDLAGKLINLLDNINKLENVKFSTRQAQLRRKHEDDRLQQQLFVNKGSHAYLDNNAFGANFDSYEPRKSRKTTVRNKNSVKKSNGNRTKSRSKSPYKYPQNQNFNNNHRPSTAPSARPKRTLVVRKTAAQKLREKLTGGSTAKPKGAKNIQTRNNLTNFDPQNQNYTQNWADNQNFEDFEEFSVMEANRNERVVYKNPDTSRISEDIQVISRGVSVPNLKESQISRVTFKKEEEEKKDEEEKQTNNENNTFQSTKNNLILKLDHDLSKIMTKIQEIQIRFNKINQEENDLEKQAEIEQTRVDNFLKVLDQDPSDVIFGTLPENKIFTPKMTKQQLDNLQKVQEKAKKQIQKLEELEYENVKGFDGNGNDGQELAGNTSTLVISHVNDGLAKQKMNQKSEWKNRDRPKILLNIGHGC